VRQYRCIQDNQPDSGLVLRTVSFVGHDPQRSSTTSSRGTEFMECA
jgi:hypothetical protein